MADDSVVDSPRPPTILLNSSLVTGLIALALGGAGVYGSQDRFTASDWAEGKRDIIRIIDTNQKSFQSHIQSHPDKGLDERLRTLELDRVKDLEIAVQRITGEMEHNHP